MRRVVIAGAVIVVGLCLPAKAGAAWAISVRDPEAVTRQERVEYGLAVQYWGRSPECGTPTLHVSYRLFLDGHYVAGLAERGGCEIYLDQADQPRLQCRTMIHEVGHLLGLEHSTDPTSVMYPEGQNGDLPAVCRRWKMRWYE
jgi:predicted Zn-dependent protease